MWYLSLIVQSSPDGIPSGQRLVGFTHFELRLFHRVLSVDVYKLKKIYIYYFILLIININL